MFDCSDAMELMASVDDAASNFDLIMEECVVKVSCNSCDCEVLSHLSMFDAVQSSVTKVNCEVAAGFGPADVMEVEASDPIVQLVATDNDAECLLTTVTNITATANAEMVHNNYCNLLHLLCT